MGKLRALDKRELQARLKRIAETKKIVILLRERESEERLSQIRRQQEKEQQVRREFDLRVAIDR
jgi:hypothetical protein